MIKKIVKLINVYEKIIVHKCFNKENIELVISPKDSVFSAKDNYITIYCGNCKYEIENSCVDIHIKKISDTVDKLILRYEDYELYFICYKEN